MIAWFDGAGAMPAAPTSSPAGRHLAAVETVATSSATSSATGPAPVVVPLATGPALPEVRLRVRRAPYGDAA